LSLITLLQHLSAEEFFWKYSSVIELQFVTRALPATLNILSHAALGGSAMLSSYKRSFYQSDVSSLAKDDILLLAYVVKLFSLLSMLPLSRCRN